MISAPEARGSGNRGLRIALVASVLVHVVLIVLALLADRGLQRLLVRAVPVHAARKPQDEIVTISSAVRFEKRARPVPAPPRRPARPQPHRATPPRAAVPRAARLARAIPPAAALPRLPVVVRPTLAPPERLRHELAKSSPHAPVQAKRSNRASATVPRTEPRHASPPVRTAYEPPRHVRSQTSPSQARAAAARAAYSQERLAQIERDLARTIAQARASVDPIRTVPREPPAAPKHYRIQMQGLFGTLRRGQGTYSPIKAWRANGLDYYYVSYEFVYANGTYETGTVPWPIHFDPRVDPFTRDDPSLVGRTPLPGPPPGYEPPGTLGKALRSYFPNLRFEDSG